MEWNVYYYSMTKREIVIFNIFNHSRFKIKTETYLKECNNKEEFAEKLRKELMYYFWCKSEYEILISAWCGGNGEETVKIDIYSQVRLNWDRFVDYCWSFKKPKIREKIKEKADDR